MSQQEFDIKITANSVDVRHDVSTKSPRGRFYAAIFSLAVMVLLLCGLLFCPGKHDRPSIWHDISTYPVDSANFIVPVTIVVLFVVGGGYMVGRYLAAAYPSDETFHLEQSTLTVSKVAWLDVHNSNWITYSYSLGEISKLRYGVIASAKGISIRGIRFIAAGKKRRALPGLEAPEASEILKALRTMGADVVDDPKLQKRVEETLKNRWPY